MPNIFRGHWDVFMPIPQRWTPGTSLSGALLNFHDVLVYLSWAFSTARFENLPNSVFRDLRQMDPDSVKAGRDLAWQLRWVGHERRLRGTYTYWFLDADGGELRPFENPNCRFRSRWVFNAVDWRKHLHKRAGTHRVNADTRIGQKPNLSIGQTPMVEASRIGKNPIDHRVNADSDSSQIIESSLLSMPQNTLKETLVNKDSEGVALDVCDSDAKGSGEVQLPQRPCGKENLKDSDELFSPPTWNELGKEQSKETKAMAGRVTKERGEEIAASLAQDPVVRRLAEKFGKKIVGVADLKRGTRSGDIGSPGLPFEKWDEQQRRTKRGGHVLTREEALSRYGHSTPPVKASFVTPEPYTPRSQLGQPARCAIHGVTDWWRRADGELICDRCHPNPNELERRKQ